MNDTFIRCFCCSGIRREIVQEFKVDSLYKELWSVWSSPLLTCPISNVTTVENEKK